MPTIRRATAADAELLAEQRMRMYMDAGMAEESAMGAMRESFMPWVRERIRNGSYAGWISEDNGRAVGGAGLWVMEWPPHFLDAGSRRGYLLNFYVAPEARRHGIARELLGAGLAEAKVRGLRVVTLHASKYGQPLYEQLGFKAANEMRLVLEP